VRSHWVALDPKNHPFSPSNLPKVRSRAECISSVCAPAEAKHAEQKRQERAGIECGEDDDFTAQARDPGREGPPQSLLEEIIALPKYLETAVAFSAAWMNRVRPGLSQRKWPDRRPQTYITTSRIQTSSNHTRGHFKTSAVVLRSSI
jgi:hypothetical protein